VWVLVGGCLDYAVDTDIEREAISRLRPHVVDLAPQSERRAATR
jgi:hypothetical protein